MCGGMSRVCESIGLSREETRRTPEARARKLSVMMHGFESPQKFGNGLQFASQTSRGRFMTRAMRRLRDKREELDRAFQAGGVLHLRDRLRNQRAPQLEPERLSEICGVKGPNALSLLSKQQSHSECLAALMLVPVLLVIRADRKIMDWERCELLDAAEATGIEFDAPAFQLLGRWLNHRPDKELQAAWKQYVRELCREFSPADRAGLAERVLSPARRVAETSGSRFHPWSRERRILRSLAEAFDA